MFSYGNFGCHGGWQPGAFQYLEKYAQATEAAYPYTSGAGGDTGSCSQDKMKGASLKVTGYSQVQPKSVDQLKAAVNTGVVTVSIRASSPVFQQYKSGILDSPDCADGLNVDHAVAVVGYGSEGGKSYYIVRNSWGATWGDQGYVKIAAVEGNGICGIQLESYIPTTN